MSARSVLARNAVRVRGDGDTRVYVHGFGCDQSMWEPLIGCLPAHCAITYDLTGMGASDYSQYDRTRHGELRGHADDLLEVLQAADAGPVELVGHSVSALIAGMAGGMAPELIRRVVMICPNPCYIDDPPYVGGFDHDAIEGLLVAIEDNYQGWARSLAGMVAGPDPDTATTLEQRFCRNDPMITQHFARVTFRSDLRAALPDMSRPTLIIDTSDDIIAPQATGAYTTAALPDARRVTIQATGHAPHMTHPQAVAQAMESSG